MTIVLQICAFLSPFISAWLVYMLGIKGKRKETDLQKEKDMHTVLANLLQVWHYLSKIESMAGLEKSENPKSIVPIEQYLAMFFKLGFFPDKYFKELDESVEVLKKYDPILYFIIADKGHAVHTFLKKFIIPHLNILGVPDNNFIARSLLKEPLKDIVDSIELVAKKISKKTLKQVQAYLISYKARHNQDFIDEMNEKYYELILPILPEINGKKATLLEFIEFMKIGEVKDILELQLNAMANGTLEDLLDIMNMHPSISAQDAKVALMERLKKKEQRPD